MVLHLPITNDKRQKGARSLGDAVPNMQLLPFDAVFDREFTSDVHFVTYSLLDPTASGPEPDPHPRLNKPVLQHVRDAGGDIHTVAIVLDFDLKDQPGTEMLPCDDEGKPCWTKDALDTFMLATRDIDKELAKRGIAAPLVYTTTHGARFVHKLTRSVPVEDGENLMRGMQKVYKDLDIIMDPLSDWTRLFRAPKVVRGGRNTWDERWFWLRWGAGTTNPDAIDPISKHQAYRDRYERIDPIYRDRPSPEHAHALLFFSTEKGERKTEMHRLAERILRGTPAFAPCFEGKEIAEQGARDQTLIKLVGSATSYLLGPMCGDYVFTPEDIYALFLAPVEQLEPDAGTPDWTESLWTKVRSCYERESAKVRAQEQQRDEQREQAAVEARSLMSIMRETCFLPELHSEDETVAQTALQKLMLIKEPSGRFRALMTHGEHYGSYTRSAVPHGSLHHLLGHVAKLDDHISRWGEDSKGKPKLLSEQALARMATDVSHITGGPGYERSHITGDAWDALTLNLTLYRRNPNLFGEFDQRVEDWLDLLTEDPKLLKRWLAYALDFEGGPICALSLAGTPGVGKGMLAQGLVETLEYPIRADKISLVSRFNDSMRRSPFLIVDEGLPKGENDIADKFRSLTAGEPLLTEEKYQTPIEIRNPMRIMFLANNLDVVQQLAAQRMNNADDQSAIALRLLHLGVQPEAERHLRGLGGLDHTRGWVQGANGSPSNFVVAKHLLWLYENRENYGAPDKRLLVEGEPDTPVVQTLRITGAVPEAIATAILMGLETPANRIVESGISLENDRLCVVTRAIQEQHQQQKDLRHTNVQLSSGRIGAAMSNLLSPYCFSSEKCRLENLLGEKLQQRWWDIDVRLLWNYAEAGGFKRDILESLVIAQYGTGALE